MLQFRNDEQDKCTAFGYLMTPRLFARIFVVAIFHCEAIVEREHMCIAEPRKYVSLFKLLNKISCAKGATSLFS